MMDMSLERKKMNAAIIAVIVAIIGGSAIGFCVGYTYCKKTRFPCFNAGPLEYSVLDSERVITSVGDTIRYDWQVKRLTIK